MRTPESVIEELASALATDWQEHFIRKFRTVDFCGDSPIEEMMAAALFYYLKSPRSAAFCVAHCFWDLSWKTNQKKIDPFDPSIDEYSFRIVPQWPVGPYTADFLIVYRGMSAVVECDGHDFHERTKDQAEHDRKRDRYMQSQGHMVLRFTGREIHRDPMDCAAQALWAVMEQAQKKDVA